MYGLRIEIDGPALRALHPSQNAKYRGSKFIERLHGRYNAIGVSGGLQNHSRERINNRKKIPNAIIDYQLLYEKNQQALESDARRLREISRGM